MPDRTAVAPIAALLLAALAGAASAQPFRQVLPDGRVVYSDLPPAAVAAQGRPATGAAGNAAGGDELGALPYALRTAATRHPVTLFTSADCAPCVDARVHLSRRGVPYVERTVRTPDDVAAFRKQGFVDTSFPAATIGTQRLVGFQASQWDQVLELAGYPKTSMLPAGWKPAAARPLSDPRPTESAAAPSAIPPMPASNAIPMPPPMSAGASSGGASSGGFRF